MALNVFEIEGVLEMKDQASEVFEKFSEHVELGGKQIAAGIGLAVGAMVAATVAIVELGEHGARVNAVTEAFNHLNEVAGGDGPKALEALREGSRGLISDFELMRPLNAALSAGLKLNATDAYNMSRAAVVLAEANGKTLADSYDTIAQALTTGRTRSLAAIGVMVEQKGATLDLKNAMKAQGEEMLTSNDLAAKRQAIFEALNSVVLDAGDGELNFAQKIERAKVGVENMTNSISAAIASSPVLGVVMDKIGDALQGAFGAHQTQTIQTIIGYVNQFAIFLVNLASVAVTGAEYMVGAFDGLKIIFSGLMTVVFAMAEGVNKAFASILEGATHLPGVGDQFKGMAAAMRDEADQTEGMRKSFQQQTKEAIDNGGAQMEAFEGTKATLGKLADQMAAAAKQGVSNAEVAKNLTHHTEEMGKAHNAAGDLIAANRKKLAELNAEITLAIQHHVSHADILKMFGAEAEKAGLEGQAFGNTVTKAVKDIGDEFEQANISNNMREIAKIWAEANDKMAKSTTSLLDKWTKETQAAALKVAEAHAAAIADQLTTAADYHEKNYQLTLHGTDLEVRQIQLAHDAEIAGLTKKFNDQGAAYQKARAEIDAYYQHQIDLAQSSTAIWISGLDAVASVLGGRFGSALSGIAANIQKVTDAHINWSHSVGIASPIFDDSASTTQKWSAAVQSGTAIAAGAMAVWNASADAGSKSAGALHGAMAGAKAGAAFGPWGMAIGAAAGALVGFIRNMNAGRKAVDDFAASFDTAAAGDGFSEMHAKLQTLGAAGEALWVKLTQGVGRSNPAQAKAVIAEITAAFADQQKVVDGLNSKIGDTLQQILAVGGGVPAGLQPYLDKLKEAGLLTQGNIDLLGQMGDDGVPTWKEMEKTAAKYNLTIDQLGPTFRDQKLHASYQEIIDDVDLLTRGGADVNSMLETMGADGVESLSGLGKKVNDLVDQSMKFGIDIPANMKPWVQKLIDAGLLLDDSGKKITDIDKLKFGEDMQTSLNHLNDTLKDLVDVLKNQIPAAIGALPKHAVIDVEERHRRTDAPDGGTSPGDPGTTPSSFGFGSKPSYSMQSSSASHMSVTMAVDARGATQADATAIANTIEKKLTQTFKLRKRLATA